MSAPSGPARPPALPRRHVVALGLAGAAAAGTGLLGGCDLLGGDDGEPGPAGRVEPTAPAVDADRTLVEGLAPVLDAALVAATSASALVADPGLVASGQRLVALHRSHAVDLGLDLPTSTPSPAAPAAPADPAAARTALTAAEQGLQEALVSAALAAGSGALAQLLGAMAAAVAQERRLLA